MFPDSSSILQTDWLRYRWPVELGRRETQGQVAHTVTVGGCELSRHRTPDAAKRAASLVKPIGLDAMINRHPEFAGGVVLIEGATHPVVPGQSPRLARIPPRLWPSYDVVFVSRHARYLSLISTKARAMFPRHHAVFVRAYAPIGKS